MKQGTMHVEFKKCPYCNKEFEVELKGSNIEVFIRKEEESILPESLLKYRQIAKRLTEKGISHGVDRLMSIIIDISKKYKRGVPYDKIKYAVKDDTVLSQNQEDIEDILEILKGDASIYEPKKGVFKIF